jgi:hypothetical protein
VPPITIPDAKKANRRVLMVVVGIMLVAGISGLAFALMTQSRRGLVMLSDSSALGYLPGDTNVILGLPIASADQNAQARELLDRIGLGQGDLNVEALTGLRRDDISEIVLGLHVGNQLLPAIRLIVKTRQSLEPEKVAQKLGAFRTATAGSKTIQRIKPPGLPLEAGMWCPDARTLVICSPPEDLANVPDEPFKSVDLLSAPLADLLKYRPEKETVCWAVAHHADWSATALPLLLTRQPKELRDRILSIQTAGIGIRIDSGKNPIRARPARATEVPTPEPSGIALDLTLWTKSPEQAVEIKSAIEAWINGSKLTLQSGGGVEERRYTLTVTGDPVGIARSIREWDRAAPKP